MSYFLYLLYVGYDTRWEQNVLSFLDDPFVTRPLILMKISILLELSTA